MPHEANAALRHRIPRPKRKLKNRAEYDASLRERGCLTMWFTEDVITHWKAAPRTTPGGQPSYSDLNRGARCDRRSPISLRVSDWVGRPNRPTYDPCKPVSPEPEQDQVQRVCEDCTWRTSRSSVDVTGVSTSSAAARRTTAPLMVSISVVRPARMSCSIDGLWCV